MQDYLIGGGLLAASICMTVYQESYLRAQIQSYEIGRQQVISLSHPVVKDEHDGQLVHFSGLITNAHDAVARQANTVAHKARSPHALDPTFGIAARGVRLHRIVEMYQWVETSHTSYTSSPEDDDRGMDDTRERIYMYDLEWRADFVNSAGFRDMTYWNPPEELWTYHSEVFSAGDVAVGDFLLNDRLLDQITRQDVVRLDQKARNEMETMLEQRIGEEWKATSALMNVTLSEEEEYYYYFQDRSRRQAEVGDLRISFKVTPAYPVTVCGQQKGNEVQGFDTIEGERILLLEDGVMSAEDMFNAKVSVKSRETRFFRLFAAVLGFISMLVLRTRVLPSYFAPIELVQKHLTCALLSLACTSTTVAIVWLFDQLVWSVCVFAGGVSPVLVLLAYAKYTSTLFKSD